MHRHEPSYTRAISTAHSKAAGEVITLGTCTCGTPVMRFEHEGMTLRENRTAYFPTERYAALAPQPFGPLTR